ncbi:MAG: DUF6113 family protein [Carbonactinosporaceae bacterium]
MIGWLTYPLLAVLGALAGVAGAFTQGVVLPAGPVPLPVGLVTALAASGALFAAGKRLVRRRLGAALPFAAWLAVVLRLIFARPEGDVVLAPTVLAYSYLLLGTLWGTVVVTAPADPVGEPPNRPTVGSSA